MKYILAVYLVDLKCGGPEEGGWYYEYGERDEVRGEFDSENAAEDARANLQAELDAGVNADRPKISSVCSIGRYEAHVYENEAPASFPEQRPHYE